MLLLIGEIAAAGLGMPLGLATSAAPLAWLLLVTALAGAVCLRSVAPGYALLLLWFGALVHLATPLDIIPLDAAILLVLYSCAVQPDVLLHRLAWLTSLAAIPLATLYFLLHQSWVVDVGVSLWSRPNLNLVIGLYLALCATFLAPVLLGTLVRALRRSAEDRAARQAAEAQTERAQQLAQETVSREQIARDVHDMVGHSLAVIIAQAESMAFLPPDDPRYTQAGAHIATTAREALTEVRRIVDVAMQGEGSGGTADDPLARTLLLADAPDLIARLRDTGWQVRETSDGVPQPIAPAVSAAGAAALREVVTNVLKHGDRQQPVLIAWAWTDVLRLTVENAVRQPDSAAPRVGRGLIGTRERLAQANGTFAAHPIAEGRYRATLCLPLSAGVDRQGQETP